MHGQARCVRVCLCVKEKRQTTPTLFAFLFLFTNGGSLLTGGKGKGKGMEKGKFNTKDGQEAPASYFQHPDERKGFTSYEAMTAVVYRKHIKQK
ncbi:uncharacterized protein K452DRAFT_87064 [Aplosporella prunicola CBS 121167]|uniref:Uncharacterized protein n=1 Tax=Aplosporella prunicola CBS 121167 TaxID=1176127 RepID=A0A6A6B6Q1_9PEZI|nr:uncharacterized protein K452DRAFT_87064 [Aplosporella prunicola CBS 121167]KAF2138471.1 hypothetical protein K452DRAFT_87064 [Aplosporella prunicola CBS 121167]